MSDLKTTSELILRDILIPQTSFCAGKFGYKKVKIYYISDIHLLHHIDEYGKIYYTSKHQGINDKKSWSFVKHQIDAIVNNLFSEELEQDILSHPYGQIILFGGDTSSDTEITTYFYHRFQLRYLFYIYRRWRKHNKIEYPITDKQAKNHYRKMLSELTQLYEKRILQLHQWNIDYKKSRRKLSYDNLSNCISSNNLPFFIEFRIKELWKIESKIEKLKVNKEKVIEKAILGNQFKKPKYLPIYAVLGNHELADFCTVEEAVTHYEKFFNEERIHFLHNNGYELEDFNIIGGIGFAKFNKQYNALNLMTTTPAMSREIEISESEKFFSFYDRVTTKSKEEMKHLIVLSHYSLNDWLNQKIDSICTYFTGHSHRNDSIHTQNQNVYADNQIGYKRKNIQFQSCNLGAIYNPFIDYNDGYYEITTKQYKQFLLYNSEPIQGTGLIDSQLAGGNAKFYMIKQNGFYGFFVINSKTGTKICAGGRTKNVSSIKDICYFYEYFKTVLAQYTSALIPYRKVQEQMSLEIKRLEINDIFSGKIHGCIVDVDFFHHIMINPIDGTVTFYYSPYFGAVQPYDSFGSLLADIERKEIENGECSKLKIYETMVSEKCLIAQSPELIQKHIGELVKVDIKNSVYALSNRINQLQRIFSSNILRDWNDEWAQSCLEKSSPYLKKVFLRTIKSDEEADLELEERFDELIEITTKEKNFVIWETKKQITQAMMYAICRKFINAHMNLIKDFKSVNYGYSVSRNFDYVSVKCSPSDILDIYKSLLSNKMKYAKPIIFRFEIYKNSVDISVNFIGAKDIILYQDNYIYQNKQLIKQ